ncbi:alpha/beta fold hydrolase [Streptomyces albireticuli]|uniref:alpha/beta fold hydrolase n=1 Tax=Streptomyces albireticuli TaxID=1940 RepID=UPI0036A1A0EE
MGSEISAFTGDEARERFLAAYDHAMGFWPGPREEWDVETGFGTTRIHRYGTGDGAPVVLLSGANATPAVWASCVAAFAADGRPVVAVERVGEPGRSVQTAPIRTPGAMAAWLEEVLAALGADRVHLVGHSYGAWVALNQAVRAPARIASLLLVEPVAALSPVKPRFLLGAVVATVTKSDDFRRRWFGRLIGDTGEAPDVAAAQTRVGLEALSGGFRWRLMPPRKMTDEQLRSVTVPTTLVLGEHSRAIDCARAAARARRCLPHARGVIVPGAGHGLPVSVLNSEVPALVRTAEAASAA